MRSKLRLSEYIKWTSLVQHGIGVKWYRNSTKANSCVCEWTNSIKMSMNSMSSHTTRDRNQGSRHCRYPICSERQTSETLPHIRGTCPKMKGLKNSAHYKVRTQVSNLFRNKGLDIFEEVHCEQTMDRQNPRNRRVDIMVIGRRKGTGIIIDPTIRWETNKDDQNIMINEGNCNIYLPTVPYFQQKYTINEWEVVGLWFGVRVLLLGSSYDFSRIMA